MAKDTLVNTEAHRPHKVADYDELSCDVCGKHIGFVYEFDLNESSFVCDECYYRAARA